MEKIELSVSKRDVTGRKVRREEVSNVPAVIYGHGFDAQNVWVDATLLMHTFEKSGTNTVVTIDVDGGEKFQALIHDYQVDPVSNQFTHVDFFHVRMDEKVETHIPIVTEGESLAVKNLGGTLSTLESVAVKALPGDLVHEITVDISTIETFEDRITVADLTIDKNIEVLTDATAVAVSVSAPRKQEEESAPEAEEAPEAESAE